MIASLPAPPAFIDESTLRFCPASQIDRIVEIEGYAFFINEEVIHDVRCLECASWIESQLERQRVTRHQITRQSDILLLSKIANRCGVCRGEACSYIAAQRENGIVIAQDPVARSLLLPHFPKVVSIGVNEFLRNQQPLNNQELLINKHFMKSEPSQLSKLAKTKIQG